MQYAGLIFDDSAHYIDHLAPFCALLGCPLILCEPKLVETAFKFYPEVDIRYIPFWELKLPKRIITCDTQNLLKAAFPNQSTQIFWLPHGNSDKRWNRSFFDALKGETVLVYGQRMIDFMSGHGVFPKTIRIGNFRYEYFRKQIENIRPVQKNFLYAPTWDDFEKNNSFWNAFPDLAKNVPKDVSLLVKLHPNTIRKFGPEIEVIIGKFSKPNLQILPNDPPIYPLLAKSTAYIGDMSSIGYDFLTFNRPMYFINAKAHSPLHQCGVAIDPANFDFALTNAFEKIQKELYCYTFDAELHWKEKIDALCSL